MRYPVLQRCRPEDGAAERMAAALELHTGLLEHASELDCADWCRVLAGLPARWKRVVILRFVVGFTVVQTAERLEISPTRVQQIWEKVLPKLRGPLAAACGEGMAR